MKLWIAALLLEMVILTGCAQIILPFGVFEIGFTPAPMNTNVPDPTPTQEAPFPTTAPLRYVTNTTNVTWNIRKEPRVNSEDLGDLKPGEQLEFQFDYNQDIGWIGILWDGEIAYVAKACCVQHD